MTWSPAPTVMVRTVWRVSVAITLTCQLTNSSETCAVESYLVRVTYGAIPDELTGSSGETIALSDAYQYPIERIMLSLAFAKNSVRQDLSKSQAFMNEARLALGLKSQGQVAVAPKTAQSPGVA